MIANDIRELQKDNSKMLDNMTEYGIKMKVARTVFGSFFYSFVTDEIMTRDLGFVRSANISFFCRCKEYDRKRHLELPTVIVGI